MSIVAFYLESLVLSVVIAKPVECYTHSTIRYESNKPYVDLGVTFSNSDK